MIFNGPLGVAGNNENLFNTAGSDLLYDVLNSGFIHNGEHFLRHSFCFRKKSRAEAGSGNNSFSDFLHDNNLWEFLQ